MPHEKAEAAETSQTPSEVRFGTPAEWAAFRDRNLPFVDHFPDLSAALRTAFVRTLTTADPVDRVVFGLGCQSADDFFEIMLLCGNAEGHGAQKLLRSMFERVVLTAYLHAHPGEVDLYLDYYWVVQRKRVGAVERAYGTGTLDAEKVRETEENYDRVKESFRRPVCKKCKTFEVGISWTPVNLVDMAEQTGLGRLLPYAYYEPLSEAHPNLVGLLNRLESDQEHGIRYGDRLDRNLADRVLSMAHLLLLETLRTQAVHFGIEALSQVIQQLLKSYVNVWKDSDVITVQEQQGT